MLREKEKYLKVSKILKKKYNHNLSILQKMKKHVQKFKLERFGNKF